MQRVILLNSDYSFLNTINWKKAMRLLCKGKVEVLKATEQILRSADRTWELYIPKILRLVKLVRSVYRTRVPYSKKNVIYRDKYTCQYCGENFHRKMTKFIIINGEKIKISLSIDHVIPSSRGGKSSFDNCVASCKPCNNLKNDRTPREANMVLKRQPFQPTIMEFITIKMKLLGIDKILEEMWEE